MSSVSGRYQSRIFNFVQQQSQRFTQQCDRALRQLQFTSSGVAAVLLYPFYLLFQSSSATQQLYQAVPQNQSQLPTGKPDSQPKTPAVDTAIKQVLLLVDALSSDSAILNSPPAQTQPLKLLASFASKTLTRFKLSNSPETESIAPQQPIPVQTPYIASQQPIPYTASQIHGIATQLSSRTLVLVTAQNEILDILNPQQQQKLQERIIAEVAAYWRYRRLAYSIEQQPTPQRQLLSSVEKTEETPDPLLVFLDRTIAQVKSNYLAPVSAAVHTLRIQALIWAAIDYFFGGRNHQYLQQATPTNGFTSTPGLSLNLPSNLQSKHQLSSAYSLDSSDLDPWLTISDLFGEDSQVNQVGTRQQSELLKPSLSSTVSEKTFALPSHNWSWYSPRHFFQNLSHSWRSQPKPASVKKLQITKSKPLWQLRVNPLSSSSTSPQLAQAAIATEVSTPSRDQSTQVQSAPDWIETHATVMGYVKHPLEQLLEWLDRIMLWLEEVLFKVLQRLNQWIGARG